MDFERRKKERDSQGGADEAIALLKEQIRSGLIDHKKSKAAALLGDQVAQQVLSVETLDYQSVTELLKKLEDVDPVLPRRLVFESCRYVASSAQDEEDKRRISEMLETLEKLFTKEILSKDEQATLKQVRDSALELGNTIEFPEVPQNLPGNIYSAIERYAAAEIVRLTWGVSARAEDMKALDLGESLNRAIRAKEIKNIHSYIPQFAEEHFIPLLLEVQ